MSITADQQEPTRQSQEPPASDMEALARQLVALVEEFEAAFNKGHFPPEFAKRLAKLRQAAQRGT